jgi:hypothetical protein
MPTECSIPLTITRGSDREGSRRQQYPGRGADQPDRAQRQLGEKRSQPGGDCLLAQWTCRRDRSRRPALPLSRLSNRRALEEHDMEQLISRRLPARRAQSGVALIMVLIMLTAMAIAGVALVRVVDSANVISGNFAFRQSTLNIADLGVEAAVVDLEFNIPAAAKGAPWPVGCAADCRYFPVGRSTCPTSIAATPRFPRDVGSTARACRSGATQRQQHRSTAGHRLERQ